MDYKKLYELKVKEVARNEALFQAIDEFLQLQEDVLKGEEGDECTRLRGEIDKALGNEY